MDNDIPYLLLTPGPLTTSRTVREAMMADYSTWDIDYNSVVNGIRDSLVQLATDQPNYTCTLMQGSGTFVVESTLGSVIPRDGKVLVINNGAYGARITQIAQRINIDAVEIEHTETELPNLPRIRRALEEDNAISHIAMVHCETTTGMLNPVEQVGMLAREFKKTIILDAMSSFGGIPMTMESTNADFLISSANKCIQGVPGFGFVIARKSAMQQIKGRSRSLSLDLHDQWRVMKTTEANGVLPRPHMLCTRSPKRFRNCTKRGASLRVIVVIVRTIVD